MFLKGKFMYDLMFVCECLTEVETVSFFWFKNEGQLDDMKPSKMAIACLTYI